MTTFWLDVAVLCLALGVFFAVLLAVAVVVESLVDDSHIAEWF
jgi:hypothetical protein